MNKKISIGATISFMAIAVAITFVLTTVISMRMFNNKMYNISERETMYNKVAEIDKIVRNNFYGQIDENQLNDSIAKGYLNGLGDKHSLYLTAAQYDNYTQSNQGNIVGIGVETMLDKSGYGKVIKVYENSPAALAGVQVEDLIVKIGNIDITAANFSSAVSAIKGDAGSKVNIVFRRGTEDIPLEITRKDVEIPFIEYRVIGENGYIKIKDFNDKSAQEFESALNDLTAQNIKGLILDVRDNLGGTLESVSHMLNLLLPEGTIVSATYKDGETKVLYTSDERQLELPMVVLGNDQSASASELLISALRDYDKAKFVGINTYGKGTIQEMVKLTDGSAVDVTVALFNPPTSANFNGVGLAPDFEVKLTTEEKQAFYMLNEQTDPQFAKAIEVLEGEKKNQ